MSLVLVASVGLPSLSVLCRGHRSLEAARIINSRVSPLTTCRSVHLGLQRKHPKMRSFRCFCWQFLMVVDGADRST